MINKDILKKQIIYRSTHRGSKEMDIILGNFVKKHIDTFTDNELRDVEELLCIEDEILHRWYFDKGSIINCFGQIATLGNSQLDEVEYIHTFGMSNCLTWLKEKRPIGDLRIEGISPAADKMWSAYLQSTGQTDTLILKATKIGT